jgi:hypothetical protein
MSTELSKIPIVSSKMPRELSKTQREYSNMLYLDSFCINGDLNSIQKWLKHENEKIMDVEVEIILYIFYWCSNFGHLDVLKWIHSIYFIEKTNNLKAINEAFAVACYKEHLDICEWIFTTFRLTKEKIIESECHALYFACNCVRQDILLFLSNSVGFTIEDTNDFIDTLPKYKLKKITKCLTPIGCLTKSAVA